MEIGGPWTEERIRANINGYRSRHRQHTAVWVISNHPDGFPKLLSPELEQGLVRVAASKDDLAHRSLGEKGFFIPDDPRIIATHMMGLFPESGPSNLASPRGLD